MATYLREAFQQMDLLESNDFTFDNDGATKLANFMDNDMLNDFEAIIDPEAETKEDLKDSYIGNVVCECQICKSKIYKEPEEITVDEESAMANVGECCPYCFEHDGFKIIGQIAPYEEVTVEAEGDVDVKVNGDDVKSSSDEDDAMTARHAKDNEDLEDSQRFPVEGTKQVDLTEKKSKRHARDNEDLEDSQRYPIKSPVGTKGLKEGYEDEAEEEAENKEDKKVKLARKMRLARHKKDNEDLEDSQRYPVESPQPAQTGLAMMETYTNERGATVWSKNAISWFEQAAKEFGLEDYTMTVKERRARDGGFEEYAIITATKDGEKLSFEETLDRSMPKNPQDAKDMVEDWFWNALHENLHEDTSIRAKLKKAFPQLNFDKKDESLKEGMEDISITTDDQVIKVKATPRADKEAIQPLDAETQAEVESAEDEIIDEPVEDTEIVEETPEATEDVEVDEFDEETFNELGEAYLKRVYDNVSSFKTVNGTVDGNRLILEGVINFNSGKSAKTRFVFESHMKTKNGKLKFRGMNEHISSRMSTYTLTGKMDGSKLILESLNYNYGAKSNEGKVKRLYGTVRTSK